MFINIYFIIRDCSVKILSLYQKRLPLPFQMGLDPLLGLYYVSNTHYVYPLRYQLINDKIPSNNIDNSKNIYYIACIIAV